MRKILTALLLLVCGAAMAQDANKLYEEGKALYDAKKYVQAIPKLKAAAEKGHKKAQYRLGKCYDKGNGVKEDDKLAVNWYAKAAEQGHAKSQYRLGQCYADGRGVDRDFKQAVRWYLEAAERGNRDAKRAIEAITRL